VLLNVLDEWISIKASGVREPEGEPLNRIHAS